MEIVTIASGLDHSTGLPSIVRVIEISGLLPIAVCTDSGRLDVSAEPIVMPALPVRPVPESILLGIVTLPIAVLKVMELVPLPESDAEGRLTV